MRLLWVLLVIDCVSSLPIHKNEKNLDGKNLLQLSTGLNDEDLNRIRTKLAALKNRFVNHTSTPKIPKNVSATKPADKYAKSIKVFPPLNNPLNDYLYQGDMFLTESQLDLLLNQKNLSRPKRQAIVQQYRWPTTTIPYFLDSSLSQVVANFIPQALAIWQQQTCLKFVQNSATTDMKIRFYAGTTCYSYVGTEFSSGATHDVSLNDACNELGLIIHEIGHAIGLFHEQSRYDRDTYVQVDLDNVQDYYKTAAYAIETQTVNDNLGIQYDYGSIMHYADYAYAIDSTKPTMIAVEKYQQHTMGQLVAPGFLDYQSINLLYGCTCPAPQLQCQNGGYPNPGNCAICNCPRGFGGTLCNQRAAPVGATCGTTVTATSSYQTLTGSLGQNDGVIHDTFSSCHYHIASPAGTKVQIQITSLGDVCTQGCYYAYTEYKLGNFPRNGYRFCCPQDQPTEALTADGNLLIVSLYTRYGAQAFTLQYKYT